ncbi:MAG: hypothetical protein JWP85_2279 [Rhodoglobus sp.]|nr:hypothetical protein [Rhodoglobus sp.]
MSDSRHASAADDAEQQLVFDLMRQKLFDLFGPGGSFRITLGRATADDAVFVSTVADVISQEVASTFSTPRDVPARRAAPTTKLEEHVLLWREIEAELRIRRTGPDSIDTIVIAQHADHIGVRRKSRAA